MSRNITVTKLPITEEEKSLRNTDRGKLIFTTFHEKHCGMYIQGQRLLGMEIYSNVQKQDNLTLGAIYIGRVRDVVNNMNACFVEVQKGELCFLPLEDVKEPLLTNREYDGQLVSGDELLVQIVKSAQKGKRPQVGTVIKRKDLSDEQKETIKQQAVHRTCFSCLCGPEQPWKQCLSRLARPSEYDEVVTDDINLYQELLVYFSETNCDKTLRLYEDSDFSLEKLYSLQTKWDSALQTRIWLKSGAFLVIESTEAMTVIDVNSGKFEGKKKDDDFYYHVNREAAQEIALQLRLRNLSGIVIVDFINMKQPEKNSQLLEDMSQFTKGDICYTKAVDITPLGLMEITRQKMFKPLKEQLQDAT